MKLAKLLVSIGVLSALTGCGESDTASIHIEKARKFQASEIDSKLIALKNAVKIEPRNPEARYLLGETYLSQGFGAGATKELEKAYKYDYDKSKVVPALARAYILSSSNEDVLDLDKHVSILSDESAVRYLAYKTLASIRLENLDLAKESSSKANQLLPSNAYTLLSNAYLQMAQNKLDEAKGSVDKVLTIDSKQIDSLLLLGQINTALGNHSEATKSYLQYANLQSKSNVIVLFLAQSLLKEGKYLEAERYADNILKAAPNQPFAHYVKAMSQFELKNYQKSKEHAESALKAKFNQGPLKLIAGISSYFLGNYEQSHYHLESIIEYLVSDHPARKMFAVSQLQLGLIDEISDTLEGFNSTTKEDEKFLSSLSYQLAEVGAFDNAKKIVEKSLSNTPDDAEQNMRDGILKLMLNDPSGMQNLKEAVALKPDMLGAELALAYAAIQNKDYNQAIEIAEKWKSKYPNKPGGHNVLAAVYLKQTNIEKAKAELKKSLAISNKNIFALLELTNIAMIEGDVNEAKILSESAITEFPKNVKVLQQYYSIRQDEDAFNKIKAVYKTNEKNVALAMLYAELLIKTKKFNEASNVVDAFETSVKTPKKLWQLKVVSHNALKNINKAQSVLEEWMKVNPYHVEPIVLLADFSARNGNLEKALSIINRALNAQHNNNNMLMIGKMQLLLDSQLISEAKIYFTKLKKLGMNKTVAKGIEGKIALQEKDFRKASLLLTDFYNANPISKNIIILSAALQGNNQNDVAIKYLEAFLNKNENDNSVRAVLANIYLKNNPDKAINTYKQILEKYPNNILVLNNIAWLSMEQGDLQGALSYSNTALELAPELVNVIDTQAMILYKMDRKGESLRHLGKAHDLSKGKNHDVAMNYAEVLIASKRNKSAIKILDAIVTNNNKELNRIKQLRALSR